MEDCLTIVIISDSTGETAISYIKSVTSQFPDLETKIIRKPDIRKISEIDEIMDELHKDSVVVMTVADKDLAHHLRVRADKEDITVLDILSYGINKFEKLTGKKAIRKAGLIRTLSRGYFKMIDAIEFAIKYDDGKDTRGFLSADLVLVGVSRTSKTPTTMILATKNFKVANLPLIPESQLPQELFEIDPDRIIGLVIDPDKLSDIRAQRTRTMGLVGESKYFDKERIKEELTYAKEVFKDLDCKVIDVTENTIEQTATEIVEYYFEKFPEEREEKS